MAKNLFPSSDDQSIYFSRNDAGQMLGTFSAHPFMLEDKEWPTVEHYFHAMKFEKNDYRENIRLASSPEKARKLGRTRLKRIRNDWSTVKTVFMTRAVYTKCRAYPDIAKLLLNTGTKLLVEDSQYDYFWGCGRDRRGDNMFGQVLMNVRDKLEEEREI